MKHILLLGTGGPIACKHGDSGLTPLLTGDELLSYVPAARSFCEVEAIQVLNIDSTNIHPKHWQLLCHVLEENYDNYDGFVICHGTDTMAYTAAAMSYLVQHSKKPIVITGVLKPIVPTLFAFMTFQGALSNTFHQVAEVFRRPLHLILALFVSAVLIPIAAYAMGSLFFGSNPNLVCGIVLEYSVPVAVTAFMWISMFGGNGPLALTIILTSSVISPVTIPLTLKLLLDATVSIDVPSMMQDMAFMIAIPAVLGIVINELTRGWGHEKLSPALSPACKFMMMGVIASNSTAMSEYVLHMNTVRLEVALFILVFAISGFVVGFLVARALHLPYSETTTMCFTCGMRNISSGAVIATQYFPGEVVFPVMCGTLFQQVLASTIGHLFERLTGEERAKQRKRVKAGRDAMAR